MKDQDGNEVPEVFGQPETSHSVSEDASAPEPNADRSQDPTFIEIRTPEYVDGVTLGPATAGFNVASGRTIISYRKRVLPDEVDLKFVKGDPTYPVAQLETKHRESEQLGKGERSDWKPGVDPALLRKFLRSTEAEPERQDSSSFFRSMRTFSR